MAGSPGAAEWRKGVGRGWGGKVQWDVNLPRTAAIAAVLAVCRGSKRVLGVH
jgi:hypothetical protein